MDEKVEEIINNGDDNTKLSLKYLRDYIIKNDPDVLDSIFDKNDTCLCSLMMRKIYKGRFIEYYKNKK